MRRIRTQQTLICIRLLLLKTMNQLHLMKVTNQEAILIITMNFLNSLKINRALNFYNKIKASLIMQLLLMDSLIKTRL